MTKCSLCASRRCNACVLKMLTLYVLYIHVRARRYHSERNRQKPCPWGWYGRQTSTTIRIRAVVRQEGDRARGRCGFQSGSWGQQILLQKYREISFHHGDYLRAMHVPSTQSLTAPGHPVGGRNAFQGAWAGEGGSGALRDE